MSPDNITFTIVNIIIAIISVLISAVAFSHSKRKDNAEDLVARINAIVGERIIVVMNSIGKVEDRVIVLETKTDVFWRNVSFDIARELHSPHRPELDRLLEKYYSRDVGPERMSQAEIRRMEFLLKWLIDSDHEPKGDKVMAIILLSILKTLKDHGRKGMW